VNGISFYNCNVSHCQDGEMSGGYGILQLSQCSNVLVYNTTFSFNTAVFGGAINASQVSSLTISNSTFDYNNSIEGTPGGAVFIDQCSNVQILDNAFTRTTVSESGPIHITQSNQFDISSNRFENTWKNQVDLTQTGLAEAIGFEGCSFSENTVFSRNIIISTGEGEQGEVDFIAVGSSCSGQLNINNCDFIKGENDNYQWKDIVRSHSPINLILDNCIFNTRDIDAMFNISEPSSTIVRYSICSNNLSNVDDTSNVHINTSNIGLDENFMPIWNAEFKSLCIDNGNPNLNDNELIWYDELDNIDKDDDGSQIDIGAVSFYDGSHRNGAIKLEKEEVWNWICIPAIDYPGLQRNADFETNIFHLYHNNNLYIHNENDNSNILQRIMWWYNDDIASVYWQNQIEPFSFVHPEPMHRVRAQYGYKVALNNNYENLPDIVPVEYTGFLPGGTGNPVVGMVIEPPIEYGVGCFENTDTNVWERETWLGYYLEKSLDPFDALAPILNNIVSIKTQEWSMDRAIEDGHYTNYWEGYTTIEGTGAFNYGEAVAVRYIGTEQVEFDWGNTYPIPPELPRYERPEPQHFVFPIREDYKSIYATLDFSNIPSGEEPVEIAVYIDGECVGAEKIESTEVQIKAYLETDDILNFNDKVIEFYCWSPSKASNPTPEEFVIKNLETNKYENRNTLPEHIGNYLKVSLKAEDILSAQAPAITCLRSNYPNPFNPETTICYDLAKGDKVKLEIFNVKGQLVKTLVNESKDAGSFSAKWDGKNDKMRKVTSGVYFYRLTTSGKTLTKKMLLLK